MISKFAPLSRLSVRSVVVLLLVLGVIMAAVLDEKFRPTLGDLAKVAIGGYFGQMQPEKRSGDSL